MSNDLLEQLKACKGVDEINVLLSSKRELHMDDLDNIAGGRDNYLITGEEITPELIDRYAEFFRSMNFSADVVTQISNNLHFHDLSNSWTRGGAFSDLGDHYIDYWATIQKERLSKLAEGGYMSQFGGNG